MNAKTLRSNTRKFVSRSIISGLLGLGAISASRAAIVDLDWVDRSFTKDASIAPQKFLEVCGALKKGETVSWQFEGSAATDFNIHYHVGKKVTYPRQLKGVASATGKLAVPIDQDYCWMWTNKGSEPVNINVTLKK
jgi:hypothetical protein